MRQVVLDTETTGLEPSQGHRIIEIGCVEVINRRITQRQYHQYINPERPVDEGAFEIHGISNEFLADKPVFFKVVDDFLNITITEPGSGFENLIYLPLSKLRIINKSVTTGGKMMQIKVAFD